MQRRGTLRLAWGEQRAGEGCAYVEEGLVLRYPAVIVGGRDGRYGKGCESKGVEGREWRALIPPTNSNRINVVQHKRLLLLHPSISTPSSIRDVHVPWPPQA